MKYSVFYSFQAPKEFGISPERLYHEGLEQIAIADDLGFHQVWLTEHHFMNDGRSYCRAHKKYTNRPRSCSSTFLWPSP